ncbi:major facilitator superfamily domain-containing protein [Mycotypha africana]|uniref:major facilitator superfamily domain-containing protein n=1 Tax=Mycotypha africana TaxID=64632 RepID=UPI002301D2D7|nr:major facilitator superfamily domain-containing protein [Mycotypha africana]KAI8977257.1 major facilitator superfamily domain-containing protein [Mycotypha africana]
MSVVDKASIYAHSKADLCTKASDSSKINDDFNDNTSCHKPATATPVNIDIEKYSIQDAVTEEDKGESVKEPYSIFTTPQLIRMLTICSLTAMISPLTASIYLPAVLQIENEMKISTEQVNLTITVYMVFQAVSPTFWGTIADSYGRRPVLMITMLVYCAACTGLALAPNYAALTIFRMLQAFGSSSVIAISAGLLGDIVDSKKRGSYFGVYSLGQLLGPALGPVLGGIITEELGWRWIFWILVILGGTSITFVGFFVPETLRSLVGNGSGYANPTPYQYYAKKRGKIDEQKVAAIKEANGPRSRMNFLAPFIYLREPDVLIALLHSGIFYTSFYSFLTSTTKQFNIHYGLSELQIGLCFLCQGGGTLLGSYITGMFLDREYKSVRRKFRLKHPDQPDLQPSIYTARLRSSWISLFFADTMPLVYGWAMHANAPLPAALIIQFIAGFSTSSTTIRVQSLIVDLFPGKGASITASNNLIRCMLGAIATVAIDPGIEGIGIGWMFTVISLFVTVSNIAVPVLLKFGPRWKEKREARLKQSNG